jgi:hypothetical protein
LTFFSLSGVEEGITEGEAAEGGFSLLIYKKRILEYFNIKY